MCLGLRIANISFRDSNRVMKQRRGRCCYLNEAACFRSTSIRGVFL